MRLLEDLLALVFARRLEAPIHVVQPPHVVVFCNILIANWAQERICERGKSINEFRGKRIRCEPFSTQATKCFSLSSVRRPLKSLPHLGHLS